ncbi:MAG: hypothetical protein ACK5IQ_06865, partial [Bacteroidales bacterium]
ELHNSRNDTLELSISNPVDDCATKLDNPNLWYINDDTTLTLVATNLFENIIALPPHTDSTIQVRLLNRLNGSSLKDLVSEYHYLVNGDFIIKSTGLSSDTLIFRRSPDLIIQYKLDGELVTSDDSAKMNKVQIKPPKIR